MFTKNTNRLVKNPVNKLGPAKFHILIYVISQLFCTMYAAERCRGEVLGNTD